MERLNHIMSNKSITLNKPFNKKVLAKAKEIASKYEIMLTLDDGTWFGKGLEMPFVFGEGKTPNDCVGDTREALAAAIALLIENNKPVPIPASEGKRTEQVNVRLTAEEKTVLATKAKTQGFNGISDLIRSSVLST